MPQHPPGPPTRMLQSHLSGTQIKTLLGAQPNTHTITDAQLAVLQESAAHHERVDQLFFHPTAETITANHQAANHTAIRCNSNAGGFTITLPTPPTPGAGAAVRIVDTVGGTTGIGDGGFGAHPVALLPGTGATTIMGHPTLELDAAGLVLELRLAPGSTDWRIFHMALPHLPPSPNPSWESIEGRPTLGTAASANIGTEVPSSQNPALGGTISVAGSPGAAGQVLTSHGPEAPAGWSSVHLHQVVGHETLVTEQALEPHTLARQADLEALEPATILRSADLGATVQPYSPHTVVDPAYVQTQENFTSLEKQKLAALSPENIGTNVDWVDITGKPAFGTAALANTSAFATAAQGALAQSALQPAAIADFETTAQLNARDSANRARSAHTGTQPIASIDGLQGALDSKQPSHILLTGLTYLSGASGIPRKDGPNSWVLDTTPYLTAHPAVAGAASPSTGNTGLSFVQNLGVDQFGHLTSIGLGTVPTATTSTAGVVQLNNTTSSTSTTQAATANAVKEAWDLANGRAPLASPTFTGTPAAPTAAVGTNTTQLATTAFVQGAVGARFTRSVVAMGSSTTVDCNQGNYFSRTVGSNVSLSFSNPPPSGTAYSFTLEIDHTGGTITWPASVRWAGGTAPTLTTGRTHLFVFATTSGGTVWLGGHLTNYNLS